MIDTFRQRHRLPMVAPAAILTGIGRIDSDVSSASFFRFAGQFAEKLRPRCIMNALSKTVVMGHPIDVQVLNADDSEAVNDLSAFLVSEIVAPECNAFMHTRYDFSPSLALRRTFLGFRQSTLHFCKNSLFLAEKAGIGKLFRRGEGGKGFESYVNAYVFGAFWQAFGFDLTGETRVPFASRGTPDSAGFDFPFEWAMQDDFDMPNLKEEEFSILDLTAVRSLSESEGVIASFALETREPSRPPCFTYGDTDGSLVLFPVC